MEKDKINLCDNCKHRLEFPECTPNNCDEIKFGTGFGNDNIIECSNYESRIKRLLTQTQGTPPTYS